MAQEGAKMAIWRAKTGQEAAQDGHPEPPWELSWVSLEVLGAIFCCEARSIISNNPITFFILFGVYGGPVGSSWKPSWAVLAPSWPILGDLGLSLGFLGRSCLPVSILVTNPNDHLFRGVISLASTNWGGLPRVGQLVGQLSFEKVCVT